MRFMMYPNATRPEAVAFSEELADWLISLGHTCVKAETDTASLDAVLVVGGDGTVLRAVRDTYGSGIPCWAVNYGNLGFLTQCQPDEAKAQLMSLIEGRAEIEKRATMEGGLIRNNQEERFFAINEAVIHRSSYARTLRMTLYIGGNEITTFAGDGLLISTPTGSTAYNLSAGGPILLPGSEQLVITPICPHSAIHAPIVVSKKDHISVRISVPEAKLDEEGCPQLVVDGTQRYYLKPGDMVKCAISPVTVDFIKTNSDSFYCRLQQRLAQTSI